MHTVAPLVEGCGLNITLISHGDVMDLSVCVCPDNVPAVNDIATGIAGENRVGHFRTAPAADQSISFLWSGDVAGQGWGIDISRGGYRSYRSHYPFLSN